MTFLSLPSTKLGSQNVRGSYHGEILWNSRSFSYAYSTLSGKSSMPWLIPGGRRITIILSLVWRSIHSKIPTTSGTEEWQLTKTLNLSLFSSPCLPLPPNHKTIKYTACASNLCAQWNTMYEDQRHYSVLKHDHTTVQTIVSCRRGGTNQLGPR